MAKINKISQETKNKIEQKTASALPDNPTKQNMNPTTLKSYFGKKALLDEEDSIVSEINRIVDEIEPYIEEKVADETSNMDVYNKSEVDNKQLETLNSAKRYADDLSRQINAELDIENVNESNYKYAFILYDGNDNEVSRAELDLPIESLIRDIGYDTVNQRLILQTLNNSQHEVDISSIISGLVVNNELGAKELIHKISVENAIVAPESLKFVVTTHSDTNPTKGDYTYRVPTSLVYELIKAKLKEDNFVDEDYIREQLELIPDTKNTAGVKQKNSSNTRLYVISSDETSNDDESANTYTTPDVYIENKKLYSDGKRVLNEDDYSDLSNDIADKLDENVVSEMIDEAKEELREEIDTKQDEITEDKKLSFNLLKDIPPDQDTLDTAGNTDTSEQMFIVGVKNRDNGSAKSYTNASAYVQNGKVYSDTKRVLNEDDKDLLEAQINAKADSSSITNLENSFNQSVNGIKLSIVKLNSDNEILQEGDSDPFKYQFILKDSNNAVISSEIIDLPLEEMIISANYNPNTKNIELTMKQGNNVTFSIADLISGLVNDEDFETYQNNVDTRFSQLNINNIHVPTNDGEFNFSDDEYFVGGETNLSKLKFKNLFNYIKGKLDSMNYAPDDTKNTAGATSNNNKLYIVGAEEQTANPQTYTNANAYVQNGALYSEGAKVITSHQDISYKANKSEVVPKSDIVANLETDDNSKVLSAKQGKILNDNKVDKSDLFQANGFIKDDKLPVIPSNKLPSGVANTSDIPAIENSLNSTNTNMALSANMGRELKSLVDSKINTSDIENSLTSSDGTKVLSAQQGRILNGKISALNTDLSNFGEGIKSVVITPPSSGKSKIVLNLRDSDKSFVYIINNSLLIGSNVTSSSGMFACLKSHTTSYNINNNLVTHVDYSDFRIAKYNNSYRLFYIGTTEITVKVLTGSLLTNSGDEIETSSLTDYVNLTYISSDYSLENNGSKLILKSNGGKVIESIIDIAAMAGIGNGTISIQKNGTTIDSFSVNQSDNKSINIIVPTQLSQLGEDDNHKFVTLSQINAWDSKSNSDTGATGVVSDGSTGSFITGMSYNASTRKITYSKGNVNLSNYATESFVNNKGITINGTFVPLGGSITIETSSGGGGYPHNDIY